MKLLAPFLLLPLVVLADVGLFRNGAYVGPVKDLNCRADGGLTCVRDAGTAMGQLSCTPATSTETGCVTPSFQTFGGGKAFTDSVRVVGVAHASLTACIGNYKGRWQTCTTHSAPVFCDGASNIELLGNAAPEQVLASVYVNGIPTAIWGGLTLPSTAGWTLNALGGLWLAGTGAGTLRLTVFGAAGSCNCDVSCGAATGRTSCSGTCTWSAGDTLLFLRGWSGTPCTTDPMVAGNLQLMGVTQ